MYIRLWCLCIIYTHTITISLLASLHGVVYADFRLVRAIAGLTPLDKSQSPRNNQARNFRPLNEINARSLRTYVYIVTDERMYIHAFISMLCV